MSSKTISYDIDKERREVSELLSKNGDLSDSGQSAGWHEPSPTYYSNTQKHCLHCGERINFTERHQKWFATKDVGHLDRDEFKCEANVTGEPSRKKA